MSYCVVRVQKMGGGSVKGIEIHDRRKKEGVSHTNGDIDWDRSQLNYDLHPAQNANFRQVINERIKALALPKAVRKDAVVMAQILVTSDHGFFEGLSVEQQAQFFKDSYDFLSDRYGEQNIISATVHLDERTPHMHFNFVPVTADGRLSAKSIFTRQSLTEQQTAFYEKVGKQYGLDRGIQGGTKKHLEVAEYKAHTASQRALEAAGRAEALQEQVKGLEGQIQALKRQTEGGRRLKIDELVAIHPQRTLTGAIKGVTVEEINDLKATAILAVEALNENRYLTAEMAKLDEEIADMLPLMQTVEDINHLRRLEKENKQLKTLIREILERIKALAPELYGPIAALAQGKNRGRGAPSRFGGDER